MQSTELSADPAPQGAHSPTKRLYSVLEAAAALGVSRSTLYGMQKAGLIRFGKILSRTVIAADEIDRVAAAATSDGGEAI